jgi:serine/threonine protein kinase
MSQSILEIKDVYVNKFYYYSKKNELSSVEKELEMIRHFKSRHAPEIINPLERGYSMKRYDYALGTTKRLERFCPDFLNEINEIEYDLINNGVNHRDINPGNLLYCKEEHTLILIDFYWAVPIGTKTLRINKLNKYYGSDKKAFKKLRKEYGKSHSSPR